ncbi:MAG: hypothetical protein P4L68_05975 [Methylovirgula sp.]|nr:hypothetical protein [Methylovirgula sp.]
MAKHHALSSYAKIIGEIAIEWNKIEVRLDGLIYDYLSIEPDVAGFILAQLGNQTKADLAVFLINKYETNKTAKENALFCIALINRLRENRNILEHAIPHLNYDRRYVGTINKIDKKYDAKTFVAPMTLLQELSATMRQAFFYTLQVRMCLPKNAHNSDDTSWDAKLQDALIISTSQTRPQLPDKISPLLPPEALEGDQPPQRSPRHSKQQKKLPRK